MLLQKYGTENLEILSAFVYSSLFHLVKKMQRFSMKQKIQNNTSNDNIYC